MILTRLYELAEREKLLEDPAFEMAPVPFVVKIDRDGAYLGIEDRRATITIPGKKGPPKTRRDKGRELPVTKAHGNTANPGFARFFADTLARVLPVSDEAKSVASRKTFWEQMERAASESGDEALAAACAFGRKIASDSALAAKLREDVEALKPAPGDRCTLAWNPDEGFTILERDSVRGWWRRFYAAFDEGRQSAGPQGLCQVTGEYGAIATVHATKIAGVPGGIASGVSVVSNDKAAFESYGLEGAANAGISFRAAEGYTRAIQALVQEKLHRSRIAIGDALFLFWTRQKCDLDDILGCLEGNDPALVVKLMQSPLEGQESRAADENAFYCLTLSGNSARAVVRDYLEARLPEVKANLRQWFADLRIVGPWGKELVTVFPLWQLAASTAADSDGIAPGLSAQLVHAAMKALPLPDNVLAACLRRLAARGIDGFTAARLGLIKLILRRKGVDMGEQLSDAPESAAYVCGRLMAVFERLQWAALGDVNANVVDRFYGTASTAPGLVFPRLFKSAQQHLGKLQADKPGMAVNLQKDLEGLCSQVRAFPGLLSLTEQGAFALGFYHQRAAYRKGKDNQ